MRPHLTSPLTLVLACVTLAAAAGCGDATAKPSPTAQLQFLHASEGADRLNAFIDNTALNDTPLSYLQTTGYVKISHGKRRLTIKTNTGDNTLVNTILSLTEGSSHTIFAANVPAKIEAVVARDDLTAPLTGKANLRVIHLAPDAPDLDIKLSLDTGNLFSKLAFKETSKYTSITAGSYVFELLSNESGSSLKIVAGTLTDGQIYTMFVKGQQKANTLDAQLLVAPSSGE